MIQEKSLWINRNIIYTYLSTDMPSGMINQKTISEAKSRTKTCLSASTSKFVSMGAKKTTGKPNVDAMKFVSGCFFGWDDKNADNLGHTYNYIHTKIFDVITHPWTNPK